MGIILRDYFLILMEEETKIIKIYLRLLGNQSIF
jgi:hypothetical protein